MKYRDTAGRNCNGVICYRGSRNGLSVQWPEYVSME